jgi:predicted GH43/DUF377 family glycosyl hydrolase
MTKNTILTTPNNLVVPLGISQVGEKIELLYNSKRRGNAKLALAESSDLVNFSETVNAPVIFDKNNRTIDSSTILDPRFASINWHSFLTFSYGGRLKIAQKTIDEWDIASWEILPARLPTGARGGQLIPEFKLRGENVLLFEQADGIHLALTKNMLTWHGSHQPVLPVRAESFDAKNISIISTRVIRAGIIVIYQVVKKTKKQSSVSIGIALLDRHNPGRVIYRGQTPIWTSEGSIRDDFTCIGASVSEDTISLFIQSNRYGLQSIDLPQPFSSKHTEIASTPITLTRHSSNPIISPDNGQDWEQAGTFNPAAVYHDDTFHMFYRAMAADGLSRFGYASSNDGYGFDRYNKPAYEHEVHGCPPKGMPRRHDPSIYASGGGWGGCEDPRAIIIDDTVYISFCVFEHWSSMRQAVTSISLEDLKNKNWNWSRVKYISPENQRQKNWMIFPEKINGKFALIHALSPSIKIEYFDSFEELEDEPIESPIKGDNDRLQGIGWDGFLRGASAPPIRTDEGWLLFYHGTNPQDPASGYSLGAMLLDLEDPTRVIARSKSPILKPTKWYENDHKPNVVYASAAVVKDGTLFIYYGGGDKHVCVASAVLDTFVKQLLDHRKPTLSTEELEVA